MKEDCSFDEYFSSIYAQTYIPPYKDVKSAEEALRVSREIRAGAERLFNLDRLPGIVENPEITYASREEDRGGYYQSRLSVPVLGGFNMLCYLLKPKVKSENPWGITALCGHGYGARQIINQGKNGKKRVIPFFDSYQKNFACVLAEKGNTVLVPELIGFGESRLKKDMHKPFYASSCTELANKLHIYGLTVSAYRVFQARCCTDLLVRLGGFTPGNLGVMGISGGGMTALYDSVLDLRIKKTVVSGYVNTFRTSVLDVWHCPDNFVPGLLTVGEMYDYASSIAPRELLLECGERDKIFPIDGSRTAVEHIKSIYGLVGAPDSFSYDFFPGKHMISGRRSFDFFN